jgi:hypothetical protein
MLFVAVSLAAIVLPLEQAALVAALAGAVDWVWRRTRIEARLPLLRGAANAIWVNLRLPKSALPLAMLPASPG